MKIKSLQLKNFKRFTDLTLQGIPDSAKLVLLIGSNGSGKSSVFDAFELLSDLIRRTRKAPGTIEYNRGYFQRGKEYSYYHKNHNLLQINLEFSDHSKIECNFESTYVGRMTSTKDFEPSVFYGRSAVRYLPRITRTSIGQSIDILGDTDRPQYFIDEDHRFENDIDLLIKDVVENIFRGINSDNRQQILEVRFFLDKINEAFPRIFGTGDGTNLIFKSFMPPAEGKPSRLIFQKGNSELDYDLLSAGEKEVVNLLFNLFVRNKVYNDSIYFMDEIDTHLNTKLQAALLREITEYWIPDNCQLWTASHSLGFIEYATEIEKGCILDLDDLDFDKTQILTPTSKNSFEIFEIAVSKAFIDRAVQGRKIIFSENTDTPFYNDLNIENILFFVAQDKNDVFHRARNYKQFGIIDRDYLSDEEVLQLRKEYPFLFFLPYYSFENLLYHPDNLAEYYIKVNKPFDKGGYVRKITDLKNQERDYISAGIVLGRSGYPFLKESENAKKLKTFKDNYRGIIDLFRSDDFETYYKVFPAKDYGRDLAERKNIPQTELAKTQWFKQQIESTVK